MQRKELAIFGTPVRLDRGANGRRPVPGREISPAADACGAVVVVLGVLLTVLTVSVPALHYAYRSAELHATLETASGMIALSASLLVFGRFRASRDPGTLALSVGLGVLAASNLLFGIVPWEELGERMARRSQWGALFGSGAGAAFLATASLTGGRSFRRPAAPATLTAIFVATVIFVGATVLTWNNDELSLGVDPGTTPFRVGALTARAPALAAAQLVIGIFWVVAAAGFLVRARRTRDELFLWLSAGASLAAVARADYILFPSLYSEWVYVGDVLRLGTYTLILAGALREIFWYQAQLRDMAAREQRRRLAHDLHDGLAQELAYIAASAETLRSGTIEREEMALVASAAERALNEAREAIVALRGHGEALDAALERSVGEIGRRYGLRTTVAVRRHARVSPDVQETLLRVAREAVANAGRHGQARRVEVEVGGEDGLYLRVRDDGCGFSEETNGRRRGRGFGLATMRERARALGGELRVESGPTGGTEVELRLP